MATSTTVNAPIHVAQQVNGHWNGIPMVNIGPKRDPTSAQIAAQDF
jgi:hypothetical protein